MPRVTCLSTKSKSFSSLLDQAQHESSNTTALSSWKISDLSVEKYGEDEPAVVSSFDLC